MRGWFGRRGLSAACVLWTVAGWVRRVSGLASTWVKWVEWSRKWPVETEPSLNWTMSWNVYVSRSLNSTTAISSHCTSVNSHSKPRTSVCLSLVILVVLPPWAYVSYCFSVNSLNITVHSSWQFSQSLYYEPRSDVVQPRSRCSSFSLSSWLQSTSLLHLVLNSSEIIAFRIQ